MDIAANLQAIQQRIRDAARRVNRNPDEITLVAVCKTKPFALVEAARAVGHLDFGENRVADAWQKVTEARARGMNDIRWHFIGSIQSRKTPQIIRDGAIVGPFALVHSVDRMKVAQRLSRDAIAANYVLSVLLEVNVSGEESKHGFRPDELLTTAPKLADLPGIQIAGLMTMAPYVAEPEETRPVFRGLRELRDELVNVHGQRNWHHLSMGMTNDFEVAIEEGATIVRIGSAIFGHRA